MTKTPFKNILIIAAITAFTNTAIAEKVRMIPAKIAITGLAKTLSDVKQASPLAVMFPTQVPFSTKTPKLYSSQSSYFTDPDYKKYWIINVDASADCNGAHYCNVGTLSAEKDGKLETKYDIALNKSLAKQEIKLNNGTTAYLTPGHAGADYQATTVEWQKNNVLYKLTWNIEAKDEKAVIVDMVNSAL
jgi:hypothetical protein